MMMIQVVLLEDDDGHWYCIPYEEEDMFNSLLERGDNEEFINMFDKYRTGGGPNEGPELYIMSFNK